MVDYLLKILDTNGRVIVPEFGAFIVKQKNPLVIVFNEFLQYNDGILINTITKKENCSKDKAKNKIDHFIREISERLKKDESMVIPRLGVLVMSKTGKISLKDPESFTRPEKISKQDYSPSKSEIKTETPVKSPEPVGQEKPFTFELNKEPDTTAPVKTETVIQEPVKQTVTTDSNVIKPPVTTQVNQPTVVNQVTSSTTNQTTQSKTSSNISKDYNTYSETSNSYDSDYKYNPHRQGRGRVLVWIILILIINGAIIAYFYLGKDIKPLLNSLNIPATTKLFSSSSDSLDRAMVSHIKTVVPATADTTESETPTIDEQTTEQEIQNTELKKESVQQTKEKPVAATQKPATNSPASTIPLSHQGGKKFYIVAGVFGEESNADNLVVKLKQKGYNAEKFGKINNLFAVSYESFATREEADAYLIKLKTDTGLGAWIKAME